MSQKPLGNWALICDGYTDFYETEAEALAAAYHEIRQCRENSKIKGVWDGWQDEAVEGIAVMEVRHRATMVDPNVPYMLIDYQMKEIPHGEDESDHTSDACQAAPAQVVESGPGRPEDA